MRGRLQLALMVMALSVLMASTAQAEGVKSSVPTLQGGIEEGNPQRSDRNQSVTTTKIQRLNEIELPATSVKDLFSQSSTPNTSSPIQITAVRAVPTPQGVEVVLETPFGEQLQVTNRSSDNNYIADIPNAQLRLPSGDAFTFRSEKPVDGVTEITVTNFDANTLRVTVTGETALPTVELFDSDTGLIVGVVTATSPTPPTSETPQEDDSIAIVVTGEQDGYWVPDASTATRTHTPLRDIPQSITVVPQQVLEDRNVRSVTEAVETVPGVVEGFSLSGVPGVGASIIRGFQQGTSDGGGSTLRNGFRDLGFWGLSAIGTVEQVEVLRGPASVLFGGLEPGGVINVITRQPLSEPYYNVALEVGNYGFFQPSIDFSGPLTDDDTVLYRFIAAYQSAESFQDFVNTDLFSIAPTITLNLGDQTAINLYYEYLETLVDSTELPGRLSDGSTIFPRDFYPGYPQFNSLEATTQRYGYTLRHEFSDSLQLRHAFAANNSDFDTQESSGTELADHRFLVIGNNSINDFSWNSYFAQIDLLGEFNTGSIEHQILVGFDYSNVANAQNFGFPTNPPPNLDISDPDYDNDDIPEPIYDRGENQDTIESYGVYVQDQIALLDNFNLLIGGRFDWISSIGEGDFRPGRTSDNSAFSPRIGLVYQPSDIVALYASYSRSFQPPPVFGLFNEGGGGEPFEPTRGTQYEVGVKTDWLDGRLSATLAAYEITRTNVVTPDPDPVLAARGFSVQVGEQRSRGIELDVTGEILPGWNMIVSYAYTDAEVTEDNSIPEGNQLTGVPENQASLWTTYTIQEGDLEGLGFGLGLFYVSDRQANLQNSFTLGDYFRTDAALYYRRDRFNAAINIRNLFDVEYFDAGLFRADPLTVTGSISWTF
ncbi:TonB-dependent siderophore receptor [Gloeocapsa sp. PCC 7428]|uniref:TonB-dependent siderophore receptor n=1 Tax=Gloeocapsa sp. PCC 7428 TaxID=1173026 RepID=UPI0002A61DBF|nr:TonB-dependent siderophore receptor [Gloeocapsa sp. PCC 7428]AFZ29086.1 TonB-dependent siderophore receptor [Gloeocapsa sp. PCC 7428]